MALEIKIVAVRGLEGVTEVLLPEGEFVIGRPSADAKPDLPIADGRVSRKHAILRRTGDTVEIENFGANGTRVNGKEITKIVLAGGEEIQVSDVVLKVEIPRPEPPPMDDRTVILEEKTVFTTVPPEPVVPPKPKSIVETMYAPPPEKKPKKGFFSGEKKDKAPAVKAPSRSAAAPKAGGAGAAKGPASVVPIAEPRIGKAKPALKKKPRLLVPALALVAVMAAAYFFLMPSGEKTPGGTIASKNGAKAAGTEAAGGSASTEGAAAGGAPSDTGEGGDLAVADIKATLPGAPPENQQKEAANYIAVGNDYWDESNVEHANLYHAIDSWQKAQAILGRFEIRPPSYPELGLKIATAEKELAARIEEHKTEAKRLFKRWQNTSDRKSARDAYEHMRLITLLVPEPSDPRNKAATRAMEQMKSAIQKKQR